LLQVFLKNKTKGAKQSATNKFGQCLYVTLPQLKESLPLVILFRALGCVSDKAILSKICFDCPDDAEMSEALRASLEEAKTVETEEEALDYIAKRGTAQAFIKENRLSYTRLLLESEFLPHVSTRPNDVQRKTFFLGYMASKLLKAFLGRIDEDDRDYYGKKRLDMAGSLLASHFRSLFR
jgi:DNA-directed RNA polymerase II subunit RPB2